MNADDARHLHPSAATPASPPALDLPSDEILAYALDRRRQWRALADGPDGSGPLRQAAAARGLAWALSLPDLVTVLAADDTHAYATGAPLVARWVAE